MAIGITAFVTGCDNREVVVKGVVYTKGRSAPAANAHAIVTLYNNQPKSTKLVRYGLTADSKGRFDAHIQSPMHVTDITLELCTEKGEYAVSDLPPPGFSVSAGDVSDGYQKMYEKSKGKPWMDYETFNGALELHLKEPIRFIGKAWPVCRGEQK